jgi:heat shock protein HslJ
MVLFVTVLSTGGSLLAQSPAAADMRSELSKLQEMELRLVRFVMDGKGIAIPAGVTITLTFRERGQLSGRSAVNNYAGVFTVMPDGKITIQLTTATQMGGSPELIELEREYFEALPRVTEITIRSDRIILENQKTLLEFASRSH